MVALSTLTQRLEHYAPGASQPLMERALLDAAIEFCRDSRVISEELDGIAVTADSRTATLASTEGTRVVHALRVWFDDAELYSVAPGDLTGDWMAHTGTPVGYYMETEDTVRLYPIPSANGTLKARAATAPAHDADEVADALADRWLDAILAGALARILLVPGQPFSSPEGAQAALGSFYAAASRARLEHAKGQTGRPRTASRFF